MKKQMKNNRFYQPSIKFLMIGLLSFLLIGCQQINDVVNTRANSNGNMNANANSNDGKNMNADINGNANEKQSSSENTNAPKSVEKDDLTKQKETIADIRNVGTAMFSWLTDQVGENHDPGFGRPQTPEISPQKANFVVQNTETLNYQTGRSNVGHPTYLYAQEKKDYNVENIPLISLDELKKLLHPSDTFFYIIEIPEKDAWGNPYEYRLKQGNAVLDPQVMVIRSPGRDGKYESSIYQTAPFPSDNFDADIVWADGFFVRWAE